MTIIELKKKPLPAIQKKLELIAQITEAIEELDKKSDHEQLKKSQTVRITSDSGRVYIFTITLI